MAEQIRDALRHLEKDMGEILEVLQDKKTTEVILNPYRLFDGSYEGHVLVDRVGRGLGNLYKYNIESVIQPTIKIEDLVIYKENNNEVIFWSTLSPNVNLIPKQIADFIKYKFTETQIISDENIELFNLIDQIEHDFDNLVIKQLSEEHAILSNIDLYNKIIEVLNNKLPRSVEFKLRVTQIFTDLDFAIFKPYPAIRNNATLVKLSSVKAETIMSVLASITGKFIHNKSPYLECQIPKYGHRFTGIIPPIVPFPAFCIRKHTSQIYTLDDFVKQGVMEQTSRDTISSWIERKFNILIAGGTGSGKTTLANAILYEIAMKFPETRILIIEDVPELQFNTSRSVALTIGEFFTMYDALRTTLRFKPDRIVMGEIRGAEAYTLLKAWNTGHPGGIATIHANGVNEALYRFESCIRDHPEVKINRQEIGFTVNGIISIQNITMKETIDGEFRNIVKRKVTALRQILQYDTDKDVYQDIVYDKIPEFLD